MAAARATDAGSRRLGAHPIGPGRILQVRFTGAEPSTGPGATVSGSEQERGDRDGQQAQPDTSSAAAALTLPRRPAASNRIAASGSTLERISGRFKPAVRWSVPSGNWATTPATVACSTADS